KDGNELTGAVFTLYKEVPAPAEGATTSAKTGAEIKRGFADNIKASELKDDKYYIVIAATEAESDGDTFGFKGVDDGNYVLVETTVPNGYNAWESEAFTITAEHDVESDAPQLTKLEGGDLFTGGVDIENGVLDTDITNNSGIELPETGGIGTTIFYVVGALLVVGAGVLLVTKKRMNSAE
ncbi:MAG: LPXTG cell wall anchor domain-containing protein, partial [Clostridia bacterium]|nr:LPXTG cell wall anchor domain-containing protein [Clostridia bacterium]